MSSATPSRTIQDLLCPICRRTCEAELAAPEEISENEEGRRYKDIDQMEQKALDLEKDIIESLPEERRVECWALVASVMEKAQRKACESVKDWAEQGMLYNILMAEAWKAAPSYDPSQAKFSTWVFRPWNYAIKEFRRVKRLQTESLSASGNDPDNQSTLQDRLEDPHSPIAADISAHSREVDGWTNATLERDPMLVFMIADACQQAEWLCPFCRRALRKRSVEEAPNATRENPPVPVHGATANVYARRRTWLNLLPD